MESEESEKMRSGEEKPFRFMDMPREMRDEVYEDLLVDYPRIPLTDDRAIAASVHQGPSRAMLLVSHQFSKEYRDTLNRAAKLVLTDKYSDIPSQVSLKSGTLKSVAQAEIKILAICDMCKRGRRHSTPEVSCLDIDIREHYAWLARMEKDFAHTLASKLTVCLLNIPQPPTWPHGLPSLPDLRDHVAMLASADVPGLQEITVIWGKADARQQMSSDWREIEVVGQYCKWTKEDGWSAA